MNATLQMLTAESPPWMLASGPVTVVVGVVALSIVAAPPMEVTVWVSTGAAAAAPKTRRLLTTSLESNMEATEE